VRLGGPSNPREGRKQVQRRTAEPLAVGCPVYALILTWPSSSGYWTRTMGERDSAHVGRETGCALIIVTT